MFWLLLLLPALLAILLTITVQTDLHHFDATHVRICIRIAGIHRTWRLVLLKTEHGRRLVLADKDRTRPLDAEQLRQSRGSTLLGALRQADKARKFLLRHTHLERLDALVLLRTEDAARSALVSGTVNNALLSIPAVRRRGVRIRVLPEFFRAHSTVNARCIIHLRLGTILLTAMMLLACICGQHQQKERHAYGTSHW